MANTFAECFELFLEHEGGYVNHPNDPGGPTNMGVTLGNFRKYVNPYGTIEHLKKITKTQVYKVFKEHYWDVLRGDSLPAGVDYAVVDFGINSGPARAAKFLQKIVGVRQDGVIGPETLEAVRKVPAKAIIEQLSVDRLKFLKGLSTWPTFGKGWERRVSDVQIFATKLADRNVKTNESSGMNLLTLIIKILQALFRKA